MIPLQIKLRNFLSYGGHVQTINFEPYRLICLSGKNGHGKSALLDAITWALWGQARKTITTSKADEGLLRLGQTHMMVTFDFMYNERHYRVQREFVINNGKSHTELHFGALNEHGTFHAFTEKTTRATQQKIIDTLGLDYECCINSIFLRQGQSNEFSSKSAKERKEILTTILGISHYELLRSRALEKVKTQELAQAQFAHIVTHLTERSAQKEEVVLQYQALQKQLRQLIEEEAVVQQEIQQHAKTGAHLLERSHQKARAEQEYEYLNKLYSDKWKRIRAERDTLYSLRQQRTAVAHALRLNEQKNLREEVEKLEISHQHLITHKELLLTARTHLNKIIQELSVAYHNELTTYYNDVQKCELENAAASRSYQEHATLLESKQQERAHLEKEINNLNIVPEILEKTIISAEKNIERKKQFYHTFITRANQLTKNIKDIAQKQALTCTTDSPACPLCEQTVSGSRKRFIQEKLLQEEGLLLHQKNRLARIIPHLKEILIEQHNNLLVEKKTCATFKELLHKKTIAINEHEDLQKKYSHCEATKKKSAIALTAAHDCFEKFKHAQEKFFAQDKAYLKISQTIQELEKKIAACDYNSERYEELKKLLHLIQTHANGDTHQEQQKSLYEHHLKNFYYACKEARTMQQQLQQSLQNLKQFQTITAEQASHTQNEQNTKEKFTHLTSQKISVLQKKSACEQQLATFEQHAQELQTYKQKIEHHETEREDYATIAQALGKNGIQALLIETAIPELEYEANIILSKLTDNQSHIIIESVRDLKNGGFKETLDIKISDAVGTRSYELFSGGEAFRIDFALRIALSKLLARRSGTSLQTLIIDEGFGSQDEEGLSRIMEALYKIQDDFAKIIIVSHLTEMKNQFPTHFFVHKNSTGSQITVFEQG